MCVCMCSFRYFCYVCMYVCMYSFWYMCVCIFVAFDIMYVYIYVCSFWYVCVYVYVYMCSFWYVCVCMYVAAARCERSPPAASPHGLLHVHVSVDCSALHRLLCGGQGSEEAVGSFHILLRERTNIYSIFVCMYVCMYCYVTRRLFFIALYRLLNGDINTNSSSTAKLWAYQECTYLLLLLRMNGIIHSYMHACISWSGMHTWQLLTVLQKKKVVHGSFINKMFNYIFEKSFPHIVHTRYSR